MLAEGDEDLVVVLGEAAAPPCAHEGPVEAVVLVDPDDHGVAELAGLAEHRPRRDRVAPEALREGVGHGAGIDAAGGDDVDVPGDVARAPCEQQPPGCADELQRGVQDDVAHAAEIALAALGAVHPVHAVAQGGVPAPLGGVEALETVRACLLAAQLVAEAVALADEGQVASAGHVAQLALGLLLARALIRERAHGEIGPRHGPSPTDERDGAERQRAEDEDRRIALAHIDGDARRRGRRRRTRR